MRSSRSPVIELSDLSMREGRTLCRNMGNSGGESVPQGVARTKTASGLTASTVMLPAFIDRLSSDQRVWRKSVAEVSTRHAATLRDGALPD